MQTMAIIIITQNMPGGYEPNFILVFGYPIMETLDDE